MYSSSALLRDTSLEITIVYFFDRDYQVEIKRKKKVKNPYTSVARSHLTNKPEIDSMLILTNSPRSQTLSPLMPCTVLWLLKAKCT